MVGLSLILEGQGYVQNAWWLGKLTPSTDTVAEFKAAHAAECTAAGECCVMEGVGDYGRCVALVHYCMCRFFVYHS